MDPKDIELIKQTLEAGLQKYASGQVPFLWVSLVVGALVAAIGVTWAWGLKQSTKAADQIKEWATKVEELSNNQRQRDDERDDRVRARYKEVIDGMKVDWDQQRTRYEERISRLEAARDSARNLYEQSLKEVGEVLGRKLERATKADEEVGEFLELILPHLERLQN